MEHYVTYAEGDIRGRKSEKDTCHATDEFLLKDRFKKRRGRIDILADILSVAEEKANKTQIAYKADLNFKMLDKYLPYLMDKGFIANTDGEYKMSEKGEEFLTDYQKMKEMLM
jgi:predicted transcriptional regulator